MDVINDDQVIENMLKNRRRKSNVEKLGYQYLQTEVFKFPPIIPAGTIKKPVVPAPECRIELLPRRRFNATFDNAIDTLMLEAGKDGLNAVVGGWFNPIFDHDKAVADVEHHINAVKEAKRNYIIQDRIMRSWKVSWLLMNERTELLSEYEELHPRMIEFDETYIKLDDFRDKVKAKKDWDRFKELEPMCQKLQAARAKKELAEEKCQAAYNTLTNEETALERCRNKEAEFAARITNDHIMAEENQLVGGISAMFPVVQPGYIITKINDEPVEDLPFKRIQAELENTGTPHALEFRRYDYRKNPTTSAWETLQQVREQGRYMEDARFRQIKYVESCEEGDIESLLLKNERGEDFESVDQDGCTGMHRAAANGHITVMEILLSWGADIEARDKNMRTPLMHAVQKRTMESVKFLLRRHAKLNITDRLGRTSLMLAMEDGNFEMVFFLLEKVPNLAIADKHWGWTALHFAAASGNLELVTKLIELDANVYALSKMGFTPEQVAFRANHKEVSHYIHEYIAREPAQKMQEEDAEVWVGSKEAAYPKWAHDRGFTAVLSILDKGEKPRKLNWLEDDDSGVYYQEWVFVLPKNQEESIEAWHVLLRYLRPMLTFLSRCIDQKHKILIHCNDGKSTSAAVYAAYLLTRKKVKVKDSLKAIKEKRVRCEVSFAMSCGLQEMEDEMLVKKIERLEKRLKKSAILSIGF